MAHRSGRHFLQIPGPTNVPERVLRAMDRAIIDHRGPEFSALTRTLLEGLARVFRTEGSVIVFPASGSGGWEAALVNVASPGDRVLMFDNGFFAASWCEVARRLGLEVDLVAADWRRAIDPAAVSATLARDSEQRIRAVCVVHNETSTGVTTPITPIRAAIDRAGHPALLLVDAVSSLGSIDYRHDEWGVDVTIASSQKGLMLPPGLGFNAVSEKALAVSATATSARSYWDWERMRESNRRGFFPYTPATNLLFGLRESLEILLDEGPENVAARHARLAQATRRAVEAWGLECYAVEPEHRSDTVTAVSMPNGTDADELRRLILERFDMSLGTGLGRLAGSVFRIGHLGDFNELMLMGTLCGVEMGLIASGTPCSPGGVSAALEYLANEQAP